jgi:hypothetical protein
MLGIQLVCYTLPMGKGQTAGHEKPNTLINKRSEGNNTLINKRSEGNYTLINHSLVC